MQLQAPVAQPTIAYEPWQTVCLVSQGGTQSIQLELWDANGRNVPVNNGTEAGSIGLNVGATGMSLPYMLQNAGYTTNTTKVNGVATGVPNPLTDTVAQVPVGGRFLNTGTLGIVANTAGTIDGSAGAGNGIDGTAGRAPSPSGPFVILPGQVCYFGAFVADPS